MRFSEKLLCGFVLLGLALPAFAATKQPTAEQLANTTREHYSKIGGISATVIQLREDALFKRTQKAYGRLWTTADGKVRLSFDQPEARDFIFDGDRALYYEPMAAQVMILENFAQSPVAYAMGFLWGQSGDMQQSFAIARCKKECPTPTELPDAVLPAHTVLRLDPKDEIPTVDHLFLAIAHASGEVVQSWLVDGVGNRIGYRLSDIKGQIEQDPSIFAFEIPKGVSVLRQQAAVAKPMQTKPVQKSSVQPKRGLTPPRKSREGRR